MDEPGIWVFSSPSGAAPWVRCRSFVFSSHLVFARMFVLLSRICVPLTLQLWVANVYASERMN